MGFSETGMTKNNNKELRKFGIAGGMVLFAWATILAVKGNKSTSGFFYLFSFLVLTTGLFLPVLLKPARRAATVVAEKIGFVFTTLVLTAVFFFIVTPLALAARLREKKFLDVKFKDGRQTYWAKREAIEIERESYRKQF